MSFEWSKILPEYLSMWEQSEPARDRKAAAATAAAAATMRVSKGEVYCF